MVRQEAEVSEREGDDMAEKLDDCEEDDTAEKVPPSAPKLKEDGPSVPSTSKPPSLNALLGQSLSVVTTVVPKSAQTRPEETIGMYLEAPSLPFTDDPLEWWSTNDHIYPLLAKLAKQYLCIPCTSVAAERVSSTAGHCLSTMQRTHSTTCGPALLPS